MASYYRENGFGKEIKNRRWLKIVWTIVVVAFLLIAVIFVIDIIKGLRAGEKSPVTSSSETSAITLDSQILSSPYFQFQASKKWQAVPAETTTSHYVFRQLNNSLVQQELTVDVNSPSREPLAITRITRVQPVSLGNNGTLNLIGSVSPHCKDVIKPSVAVDPLITSYNNVKFGCNPGVSNYYVAVGQSGGTVDIPISRPNGTIATYSIVYRNVTADTSVGDMVGILKSFKTR